MNTPPDDDENHEPAEPSRAAPGGPYFGRLLIVLFLAVAFCAFMTWFLSTFVTS
jgi:hypothetical protein